MVTTLDFDFAGRTTSEERQLVRSKTTRPDWSVLLGRTTLAEMATAAAPLLDVETFSASTEHDTLGRVLRAISPDGSEVVYSYDESGNLQKVDLEHRGNGSVQAVVGDITYDARRQRRPWFMARTRAQRPRHANLRVDVEGRI